MKATFHMKSRSTDVNVIVDGETVGLIKLKRHPDTGLGYEIIDAEGRLLYTERTLDAAQRRWQQLLNGIIS